MSYRSVAAQHAALGMRRSLSRAWLLTIPSVSPPASSEWISCASSHRSSATARSGCRSSSAVPSRSQGTKRRYRARVCSTEVPGKSTSAMVSRIDPMPISWTVLSSLKSSIAVNADRICASS